MRLRFQLGSLSNGHFDQALFPLGTLHDTYLPRYATKFDAFELAQAYHEPELDDRALGWIEQAPAGFTFNAKLWKAAVAPENGEWGEVELEAAKVSMAGLEPVRDRGLLGTVVAQFPPSFKCNEDNRHWLQKLLRHDLAVEFRDPSWFTDDVKDLLAASQTPLVWSTYDKAPTPPWVTAPQKAGYVRFAGKQFKSAATRGRAITTRDRLDDVLRVRGMLHDAPWDECFVSVLNPFEGNAVDSLARIVAALAGVKEGEKFVRKPGDVLFQ